MLYEYPIEEPDRFEPDSNLKSYLVSCPDCAATLRIVLDLNTKKPNVYFVKHL